MELMSSLLLCVLVALLPQTLGRSRIKPAPVLEIKFNNSLLIQQKPTLRKQLLLNINAPPLVSNISQLQFVFIDNACKYCHQCMDRAIKAHMILGHHLKNLPNAEELQEDVLINEINYRTKRDVNTTSETIPETPTVIAKKTKSKKSKTRKSVSVTKYNIDGEVYALRVKETHVTPDFNDTLTILTKPFSTTCQVYNVKKAYSCDSPESNALLASARRKASKNKAKKEQELKSISEGTTVKTHPQTSVFKKREVDNSQVPENFMPSIEELY